MGHRTKRIRWWRVKKLAKSLVYKELCVVWWLKLHKTKRLHWFNFGLHRRAFRLHEAGERFTYIGLHVYACGLFCCCVWKPFIQGHLGCTGTLYAPKIESCGNGIRTTLNVVFRGRTKAGKNVFWWVDIQVDIQTGYSFLKNWIFKTPAKPPPMGI